MNNSGNKKTGIKCYYFNMKSCTRAVCSDAHDLYSAAEKAKAVKDGPPRGRCQSKTRSNSGVRKPGSKGKDRSTSQNSSKGSKGSNGSKGKGKGKRGGSQERKPKVKPTPKPTAAGAVSKPLFTIYHETRSLSRIPHDGEMRR